MKKEDKLLTEYFDKLNSHISLTKKENKLIKEDFNKAIAYYKKKNMKLMDILKILDINNLGTCYSKEPDKWYPLDNAAKIYPLSMKENWMSVFRVSCYLKENVVPEIFQIALLFTMKRFPTFRTSIRKGFFWHYIDEIKKRFHVYEDKMLPCSYINVSNIGKCSFKAVYYKNRISVEYFHILTDGSGGKTFLLTLVGTYLRLLGHNVSYNEEVLNIDEEYKEEELLDEFTTIKCKNKGRSLIEKKALELDGKLSNIRPCQILHFDMNANEIKELAKAKDVTVTEFILAFLFKSLSYSVSKNGYIKVQVPVNMRKYYQVKTLRNFSLYVTISIKKNEINEFDDLLVEIKKQMRDKNTLEKLTETITYTNRLAASIRYIPLFIKRIVAHFIYGYIGDKGNTTVLSNLGNVTLPNDMKEYIQKMDFSLGTSINNKMLFSMITCNDILTLSISKFTINSSVENNLYNMIKDYGIKAKVYGSEMYENRK